MKTYFRGLFLQNGIHREFLMKKTSMPSADLIKFGEERIPPSHKRQKKLVKSYCEPFEPYL